MTQFLFANNATTTLASAVAPTDATIQVASGSGGLFPRPAANQQFALTLQDAATGLVEEITYCTAVSGDTLTVMRGQEGTSARNWLVGDIASNYWTAGSAASFVQFPTLQLQPTNYAVDTGGPNTLAAALNPIITTYSQILGSAIRILKSGAANTGNVTLSVNGLGPLPIMIPGGIQIPAGMLAANALMELAYDGSRFELLSVGSFTLPGGPAGGDLAGTYPNPVAGANIIKAGTAAGGDLTGTYPNPGTASWILRNGTAAGGDLTGSYPNPGTASWILRNGSGAGGDLTGTYPSPQIAPNAVTNAKMAGMNNATWKGNVAGGYAAPQDIAISSLAGYMGISWGTNYIRMGSTLAQWGTVGVSGSGTVNLPYGYSNNQYMVQLTPQVSGIGGAIANAEPLSANGFQINGSLAGSGGQANFTCHWFTIGQG